MHSLALIMFDDAVPGVNHSPVKAPRKVPRSPYKVLDAPALQDDFYLNLVDWSSHNVLAVGLGNCIHLWNACSSKVTKLCDLGIDDCVCSVGWAQRGTHLAVGTSNGKVQILDSKALQSSGDVKEPSTCLAKFRRPSSSSRPKYSTFMLVSSSEITPTP